MIYLDNAATTSVAPEVMEEMQKYHNEFYGNPANIYGLSVKSREGIMIARRKVANLIHCKEYEIIFTSGGTESNNWAIKSVAEEYAGNHIITTKIEHPSVLNTCKYLETKGYDVTYLDVNKDGRICIDDLIRNIREDTFLISVMFTNNEIGTIQPIKEIGLIAKERGIVFHVDAVQATSCIDIDVKELNIDLMSISGHKLHAPKGIGALYIKNNMITTPLLHGGGQENGLRSGTSNVPGIVGLGKAAELKMKKTDKELKMIQSLKQLLTENFNNIHFNSPEYEVMPNVLNVRFDGISAETLIMMLDLSCVCVSGGSACSAMKQEPSHVLKAIGLTNKQASESIRFSVSEFNTMEEIVETVSVIKKCIERLEEMNNENN